MYTIGDIIKINKNKISYFLKIIWNMNLINKHDDTACIMKAGASIKKNKESTINRLQ